MTSLRSYRQDKYPNLVSWPTLPTQNKIFPRGLGSCSTLAPPAPHLQTYKCMHTRIHRHESFGHLLTLRKRLLEAFLPSLSVSLVLSYSTTLPSTSSTLWLFRLCSYFIIRTSYVFWKLKLNPLLFRLILTTNWMFHFLKSGKAHSLGLKRKTSKSVRFQYLIRIKTFLVKTINSLTWVET